MGLMIVQESVQPIGGDGYWPSLIPRYLALSSLLTSRKRITAEGEMFETRSPHETIHLCLRHPRRRLLTGPLVTDAQQPPAAQRPELAILYTIDGFSDKAPARVAMPNFQALVAQGAYFRQNWTVQTADPSNRWPPTPWAENGYTSSIPNVVQMAGTAMILPGKQKYVQDSFFPLKITAHVVNEISYRSLDGSFHYTAQAGGSGMRAAGYKVGNDKTLFWATTFLREVDPSFMWIHMQDTGVAAGESRGAPAGSPYKDNIWGEGSPYIKALQQQDVYLGQFVDALKKSGKWEKTVMFITGDHGEQTAGGHPANVPEAWTMPLVMVGPGIKKGVTLRLYRGDRHRAHALPPHGREPAAQRGRTDSGGSIGQPARRRAAAPAEDQRDQLPPARH